MFSSITLTQTSDHTRCLQFVNPDKAFLPPFYVHGVSFISEPVKPSVTISSTVLKVREHQGPISLVCIASFGSPKPSFSWYKDGLRRKACFKQMNCTYLIQYPRYPEDDGNFTCTASNTEGDQSRSMNVLIMGKAYFFAIFF